MSYSKLSDEEIIIWIRRNYKREGYVPSPEDFEKQLEKTKK